MNISGYYQIIYKKPMDLKLLLEEAEDYSNINSCSKYNKELVNCNEMFENLIIVEISISYNMRRY